MLSINRYGPVKMIFRVTYYCEGGPLEEYVVADNPTTVTEVSAGYDKALDDRPGWHRIKSVELLGTCHIAE